jgi:hypothetical protein
MKKSAFEPVAEPVAAPVEAEPPAPEPAPFVEPPLPAPVAAAEAPPAPIASTAEEVAESLAPKSSARLSRMKKPGDKPASSANGREGRAGPGSVQAGAEGRERKFVAKPKAAAESREAARVEPAGKTEQPTGKASQDKIAAVQSGKKKLRGIRINPDLE